MTIHLPKINDFGGGNGGGGGSTGGGKLKIKDITPSANITVTLEKKYGAYRIINPTQAFSLTIDGSGLNLNNGELYDFVLIIDMSGSSQAYDVTWDTSKIEWGNTSPTMTAMVKYMFSFCTDDGGTTWVGNQMFSFLPKGE